MGFYSFLITMHRVFIPLNECCFVHCYLLIQCQCRFCHAGWRKAFNIRLIIDQAISKFSTRQPENSLLNNQEELVTRLRFISIVYFLICLSGRPPGSSLSQRLPVGHLFYSALPGRQQSLPLPSGSQKSLPTPSDRQQSLPAPSDSHPLYSAPSDSQHPDSHQSCWP